MSALEHTGEGEDGVGAETASSPSPPSTCQHLGPQMAPQLLLAPMCCFSRGKLLLWMSSRREAPSPPLTPLLRAALQLKNANWEMDLKCLKFCLSII